HPSSIVFPYSTLFRSGEPRRPAATPLVGRRGRRATAATESGRRGPAPGRFEAAPTDEQFLRLRRQQLQPDPRGGAMIDWPIAELDRKSTRLNSSHVII